MEQVTVEFKDGTSITADLDRYIVHPHVVYVELGARRVPLPRTDLKPLPTILDAGNTYAS